MADEHGAQNRQSMRWAGYDYASAGTYFVTICTAGRACLFGEVVDGEMRVNRIGRLVEDEWMRSGEVRPEINIGVMALMPDHLHGIVTIMPREDGNVAGNWTPPQSMGSVDDTQGARRAPLRPPRSLGSMIAGFKAATTRIVNEEWGIDGEKQSIWQRGYYDRVVRDQAELERIEWYIVTNPERWKAGEEFLP